MCFYWWLFKFDQRLLISLKDDTKSVMDTINQFDIRNGIIHTDRGSNLP